jgi:hypothetical protein
VAGGLRGTIHLPLASQIDKYGRAIFENKIKEQVMRKQTLKNFAVSLVLLGVSLIPSPSIAQVRASSKLPGKRAVSSAARAPNRQTQTPGSPSYTYTLLNFPGTLFTQAAGINPGATTSKTEIVGGYGPLVEINQGGFLARVSGKKTVVETYKAVNYPHGTQQYAVGVNDSGQIVGVYLDSSDAFHGYELNGAKFTTLNVPFVGATGTIPSGINNAGEVVGSWLDSDDNGHSFMLIGGTYTSFDYPGAIETDAIGVNSAGEIAGQYQDASGVWHGFLLSGGTFTSFDFPGAVGTGAEGINDAGNIVGWYCTTTECLSASGEGQQGFLLNGAAFTTIDIPGEFYTQLIGINNNGVIVGFYQDAAGLIVGFMATP